MRLATLFLLAAGCGCQQQDSSAQKEISELRAEVKRLKAERGQPPANATEPTGVLPNPPAPDPRGANLIRLCKEVEENGGALFHNFGININDVFDEDGHVKDPTTFCSLLRERAEKFSGKSNSHASLVSAFGSELGTQLWNGSLCNASPQSLTRPPPDRAVLRERFSEIIMRDPPGWARTVHKKLDDVLDENGKIRDVVALAELIRADTVRSYGKRARGLLCDTSLFGAEVGSAIFFSHLGSN